MNPMTAEELNSYIKQEAEKIGFLACGISTAQKLVNQEEYLLDYLAHNRNGEMEYMERNREKRLDPTLLVEGAKSIISVLYNYYPKEHNIQPVFTVSKYAYGTDYHFVVKDRLRSLLSSIEQKTGAFNHRIFTDSAPVLERAWAQKSGLGWIGKNTCLINAKAGSFFFIGELICDLEIAPDSPAVERCGTCTRCLDACPTGALTSPWTLDAKKCISYLTIEQRSEVDPELQRLLTKNIFGCDICQDVCPWNRFSTPHNEPLFTISPNIIELMNGKEKVVEKENFKRNFRHTPLQRCGSDQLNRNIEYVTGRVSK